MKRQQEFINQIRKSYLGARRLKISSTKNKTIRGTSHTISSVSEDIFAKYCADLLPQKKEIEIWVDPQISFKIAGLKNKSGKRPLLFRPDICIIENNVVKKVFDIKTDLGYKRTKIVEQAEELKNITNKIVGKQATVKDGQDKEVKNIKIAKRLKRYIVVLSSGNNSAEKLNDTKSKIKELHNILMFCLTQGDHLNSYIDNPNITITKDFELLDEKILE
jgi:hypothetical protein